jgi:hypothetical protein
VTDPILVPAPAPADAPAPVAIGRPRLEDGLARWATANYFLVNGLVVGGYAALLPAIREGLGLTAGHVSLLLLCLGAGAVFGIQAGGRLADALGARRICLASLPLLAAAMLAVSMAASLPVAMAAAALVGLGSGTLDVAASALAVNVERAAGRPLMGVFHGAWSVANVIGAAIILPATLVVGSSGSALATAVGVLIVVAVLALLPVAWRITPETAVLRHVDASGRRTQLPRAVWILALIAVAHGLAEGVSMDWSAMHVTDVAGVQPGVGSLGLVAVTVFMFATRVSGDVLVARSNRRAVIMLGGVLTAAGYLVVATVTPLPALLAGWALVGGGVGLLSPQIYAAAGHAAGGRGLAVVLTFDYTVFFIGPAAIGPLVDAFGMAEVMLLPAALSVALVVLSRWIPRGT